MGGGRLQRGWSTCTERMTVCSITSRRRGTDKKGRLNFATGADQWCASSATCWILPVCVVDCTPVRSDGEKRKRFASTAKSDTTATHTTAARHKRREDLGRSEVVRGCIACKS
jgi:hypothetical protein